MNGSTPRLQTRAPQTDAGALTNAFDLLKLHARGCLGQTKFTAIPLGIRPLSFKMHLPHPPSRENVIGYVRSLQDSVPLQRRRLLFQRRYEDSLIADSASRYCSPRRGFTHRLEHPQWRSEVTTSFNEDWSRGMSPQKRLRARANKQILCTTSVK